MQITLKVSAAHHFGAVACTALAPCLVGSPWDSRPEIFRPAQEHSSPTVKKNKNQNNSSTVKLGETTQGPRQHQEWVLILAEDIGEEVSEPQNQRDMAGKH